MEYINSIFHFPDSLTLSQYERMLSEGKISDKTIVFAELQKAIYKNGKLYGITEDQINPYDDTALKQAVNDLNASVNTLDSVIDSTNNEVNAEKTRLDGVIDELDTNIQNKIESLFNDYNWIHSNVDGKVVSTSTFGLEDVVNYLQQIGVWTTDTNGNTITQWSKIQQDITGINEEIVALKAATGDTSAVEELLAQIEAYVDLELNQATTQIGSTYAKISDLEGYTKDSDIAKVLEWMYSGLKTSSSANKTYAQLISAANNNELTSNGISEIRTAIDNLGDTYVANSSIESKVNDAISGLYNSATDNNAKTLIFSKIASNTEDIAANAANIASNNADILSNTLDIAAIITNATGDSSNATIATKFANWKSGLITTSNLSSSIATLLTDGDAATAGLMLKSTWDNAQASLITTDKIGNYTSGFLNETQVENIVDGKVATATATMVAKNDFTAAAIVAMVNDAESTVKINGNHLDINSDYLTARLGSASITTDKIDINGLSSNSTLINAINSQLTVNTLTATNGSSNTTISPSDGIKLTVGDTTSNWLKQDGSGFLANGNLSWNTDGNLNISGSFGTIADEIGYYARLSTLSGYACFYIDNTRHSAPYEAFIGATEGLGGHFVLKNSGDTVTLDAYADLVKMESNEGKVSISSSSVTSGGPYILIEKTGGNYGHFNASGVTTGSDITLKNVIEDEVIPILTIAEAPLFKFRWKSEQDGNIMVGTSAQYWQNVIPEAVDSVNDKLALNYSTIATASAITAAREIVRLKEENETLKAEIADIKSRLQAIENA